LSLRLSRRRSASLGQRDYKTVSECPQDL